MWMIKSALAWYNFSTIVINYLDFICTKTANCINYFDFTTFLLFTLYINILFIFSFLLMGCDFLICSSVFHHWITLCLSNFAGPCYLIVAAQLIQPLQAADWTTHTTNMDSLLGPASDPELGLTSSETRHYNHYTTAALQLYTSILS